MALMENKKQIIVFIVAVVIGLVAAVLVSNYVQTTINEQTSLLAAKFKSEQDQKEMVYRQQIDGLNQKIVEVEQRAQKAATDAATAAAAQAAAVQNVSAKKKESVSLALRMPPGKRALTVMIESLAAVGGLVNPGDYVDVIAQMNVPQLGSDGKQDSVTAMIFQNLQILAINTNITEPGSYDTQQSDRSLRITFAVTPEEASLLTFAEKNGKLGLALRSPTEKKPAMLSAATWNTLAEYVLQNTGADLGVEPPSEEPVIGAPIQVYKGGRGAK